MQQKLKLSLIFGGMLALSAFLLARHGNPIIVDAVAAATQAVQPGFSGKVISGPDVMSSAVLHEQDTLELLVTVKNPWTNNSISMAISPASLKGATLVQKSSSLSNPSWLLTWTPVMGAASQGNGTQRITFNSSFKSTKGTNVYSPYLDIKLKPAIPTTGGGSTGTGTGNTGTGTGGTGTGTTTGTGSGGTGTGTTTGTGSGGTGTGTTTDTGSTPGTDSGSTNTTPSVTTDSATAIKKLQLTSAKWNPRTTTLTAYGKIVLAVKSGKTQKLPTATTVQLQNANGNPLSANGSQTASVKPNGIWKTTITLATNAVPCQLEANVLVNGIPANKTALKTVSGISKSACSN